MWSRLISIVMVQRTTLERKWPRSAETKPELSLASDIASKTANKSCFGTGSLGQEAKDVGGIDGYIEDVQRMGTDIGNDVSGLKHLYVSRRSGYLRTQQRETFA